MNSELVIPTYNSPKALTLVLLAVSRQTLLPGSIAIADDGSGPETKAVVDRFAQMLPIRHVWHADTGFAKNAILNTSIATSTADHLIFLDGDCLPSAGFIQRHRDLSGEGLFATGSVLRLSQGTTDQITEDDVRGGTVFTTSYLAAHGELRGLSRRAKAGVFGPDVGAVADRLSPVRITWSGGNASTLRRHLLDVNGFDETMKYGGEDKELGARLLNAGIKGRFMRYSAPVLHLEHARGYVDPDQVRRNRAKILDTRRSKRVWTDHGIAKD